MIAKIIITETRLAKTVDIKKNSYDSKFIISIDTVGASAWLMIAKIPKKPKAWVWFSSKVFSAINVPAETKNNEKAHPWKNLKTKYE